jgi:hypothetical protein
MPRRGPSGAVEAVPVLFEASDQTADHALGHLSLFGYGCGPRQLSLHAGIELFELVPVKADGGIEAVGFGADVVPLGLSSGLGPTSLV